MLYYGLKRYDKWNVAQTTSISDAHNLIMSLYDNGYSLNVSDFDYTPVYFIDCDHLSDDEYQKVFSKEWQDDIQNHFNLNYIEVRHSASKAPNKAKIILFSNFKRNFDMDENNIPINIDTNYHDFRLNFETYTGLATDAAMDSYSQITFGSKIINTFLPEHLITHINCSQPKHIKDTRFNHTKNVDVIVPININEYTQMFGKIPMAIPRLEYIYQHWNRLSKHLKIHRVHKGHRYKTAFALINFVVFNAYLCNAIFKTRLTLQDCDDKIKSIIFKTFDSCNSFLKESGKDIRKSTFNVYQQFNEFLQSHTILELYSFLCKKLNIKEKSLYIPRDISLTFVFKQYLNDINQISSRKDRMEFLLQIVNFDNNLFHKIKKVYNRFKNFLSPCDNSTGLFRTTKYQYLLDEYNSTGTSVHISNKNEQIFCIKNKIPYLKVIKETISTIKESINDFFSVPNDFISYILFQLNSLVQLRNKMNDNKMILEDFINFNRLALYNKV